MIFSTHILSDVERICDYIALLNNGKLALSGTLSKIKSQHKQHNLYIEFNTRADKELFLSTPSLISNIKKNIEQENTSIILHASDTTAAQTAVIRVLFEKKNFCLLNFKF